MGTMETVNTSRKRRRGRCKKRKVTGLVLSAADAGSPEELDAMVDIQGLSALHMACRHGQLATIRVLLDSRPGWISIRDQQGRQPIHMVLSSLSSPNTSSCVRHLLEHGADVHVTTNSGVTPLHLASSEGLLDCIKILLQAGADVLAQDSMGLTPLDFAQIFCHRKVARYLRSCMWQRDKDKELRERMLVQTLYKDLVDTVKLKDLNKKTLANEKITEWAKKKGFPPLKDFSPRVQLSKFHTKCLCSDQDRSNVKTTKEPPENHKERLKKPPASSSRPWSVYTVLRSERTPKEEPDLRGSVTLWKHSSKKPSQYKTEWDSTPRSAPDLPLDVLERVLFPRAFPSRIHSPRHFEPQDIMEVQHRGCPQEESTALWSEVAMHLVEVLEIGHY